MLKAGLLGLGSIGGVHYKYGYEEIMNNNGPIKLEACFDVTEENLEKAENVRKYTDLDTFFEEEKGKLDFIDICLPTFMHKEVAIKAMKYGFHVLCEKPMALSYAETQEMCRASKETGKKLMIAQVLRFQKDFNTIREYIENKKLGNLRNVNCVTYGSGLPVGQNGWFQNSKLSGGPILDVQVHVIDLLVWMLGMPDYTSSISTEKVENMGYASISSNFVYKDKYVTSTSDWRTSKNQHLKGRNLRFNFENGYLMKDSNGLFEVDREGNVTDITAAEKLESFTNEILYFGNCIINNTDVDFCSPESSANAIRLIESQIESADNQGKIITF